MSDEQKISQRYRELGREEPPRHVDDAILSAARGAVETRPAPLVVPTGRRRWYFPLAAAAVIVLAVAVTMHVEREQPDQEALVVPSADVVSGMRTQEAPDMAKAEKAAPAPQPAPAPEQPASASEPREMRDQPPAAAADQRARDFDRLESQRLAHERQRLAQERSAQEAARADAVGAQRMQRAAGAERQSVDMARLDQRSPEQWLLGIDDLKRQGKHEEAEKQLAEFRKRYPSYKIPEAITEKFEKR